MIVLMKMNRGWIRFCSRIRQVQIGTNFLYDKSAIVNLLMDEMDRDGDVFNPRSDSLSFKDINAWLTVLIDRCGQYRISWYTNIDSHILYCQTVFNTTENSTNVAVCGVKCDTTLGFMFPIKCHSM